MKRKRRNWIKFKLFIRVFSLFLVVYFLFNTIKDSKTLFIIIMILIIIKIYYPQISLLKKEEKNVLALEKAAKSKPIDVKFKKADDFYNRLSKNLNTENFERRNNERYNPYLVRSRMYRVFNLPVSTHECVYLDQRQYETLLSVKNQIHQVLNQKDFVKNNKPLFNDHEVNITIIYFFVNGEKKLLDEFKSFYINYENIVVIPILFTEGLVSYFQIHHLFEYIIEKKHYSKYEWKYKKYKLFNYNQTILKLVLEDIK